MSRRDGQAAGEEAVNAIADRMAAVLHESGSAPAAAPAPDAAAGQGGGPFRVSSSSTSRGHRLRAAVFEVADPRTQCRWAEITVRIALLLIMAQIVVVVLGNVIAGIVHAATSGSDEYGVLMPPWWPWLIAAAVLVAGVGGGRRMWHGDAAVRMIAAALLDAGFGFMAPHGYRVAWLALPEAALFLGLVGYRRVTRATVHTP